MNIFTNDDYRKIQAWLKANAIKDSELTSVDNTIPEEETLTVYTFDLNISLLCYFF